VDFRFATGICFLREQEMRRVWADLILEDRRLETRIDGTKEEAWTQLPLLRFSESLSCCGAHWPTIASFAFECGPKNLGDVFEQVTAARARSIDASSPREQAEAEEGLKGAMKSLFAVVEAYPQLQANQNFMQLQQTLEQVEDSIQRSRRYYNAVVRDFNMSIQVFPRNLLAGVFGFHERQFYALSDEAERTSSLVRFK